MKQWTIAVTGTLALAITLVWGLSRHDEKQEATETETLARLNKKVESLHREVARQRPTLSSAAAGPATVERELPAQAASETPAPAEPEPTPTERVQQMFDELEDRFQGEPQDRAWNAEMATQIRTTVSDAAPSAQVTEVNCARSVCKVVLRHSSVDEQHKIGFALGSRGPFGDGVYYDYDVDSRPPTTTLYVMRQENKGSAPEQAL